MRTNHIIDSHLGQTGRTQFELDAQTHLFFDRLFLPYESTCFSQNIYSICVSQVAGPHVDRSSDCQFFSINPLHPSTTRKDDSVSSYRNFLFEFDCDEDGNAIPLETQLSFMSNPDFYFSTAVYSGSKSIHFILSLDDELESYDEYKRWHKALSQAIKKTVGFSPDRSASNPSRFSRYPNVIRADKDVLQNLLDIRGIYTQEELIEKMGLTFETPRVRAAPLQQITSVHLLPKWIIRIAFGYDKVPAGARNSTFYGIACETAKLGMDKSVIFDFLAPIWNQMGKNDSELSKILDSAYNRTRTRN